MNEKYPYINPLHSKCKEFSIVSKNIFIWNNHNGYEYYEYTKYEYLFCCMILYYYAKKQC